MSTPDDRLKFCINCKHAFQKLPPSGEWYCRRRTKGFNLVNGEALHGFCEHERMQADASKLLCGPDAKYFTPVTP